MPSLVRTRLMFWMLPLTRSLAREHRGHAYSRDNSSGGARVAGGYRCLGTRWFVCSPRIEAARSRRPGQLLKRRKLLAREEACLRRLVRSDAQLAALDTRSIDDHEDRESRPHPARQQSLETHVKAGLFLGLAHRGLFRRLVILDQTTGERPMAVSRSVIQPHEQHAATLLDDRVRADLHVHEVGESADGAGRTVASIDARRNERRAIARAEREARRAVDHPLASRSFR